MGKLSRTVKENKEHQAKRVAVAIAPLRERFKLLRAKRLKRWLANPLNDGKQPPRHIGAV